MTRLAMALALAGAAQAGDSRELALVLPREFHGQPLEQMQVCRDQRGALVDAEPWATMDSGSPVIRIDATRRCRVLVRRQGQSVYRATVEVRRGGSPEKLIVDEDPLRTFEVSEPVEGAVWVGETGAFGPECHATPTATRCMFIPATESGAVVAEVPPGVRFALSRSGEGARAEWQAAPWGRMLRVRAASGARISATVRLLVPAFGSSNGLLRETRDSSDARVHPVTARMLWIEGRGTRGRLDLSAPGSATRRVALADVRGAAAVPAAIELPPEETIEGDVRANGALLEGAVVLLARYLDDAASRALKEEDRPMEFLAETTTDAAGAFRFGGLARERHQLVVTHPARGRARMALSAPARPRITVVPRATARGRVLIDGVPAAGAVVSALPAFDAVAAAANPMTIATESVSTGVDGRFATSLPDEGRVSLTIAHAGMAERIELGEARDLPALLDLGDIRLRQPIDVDVHVDLEPGCTLQAVGPMGEPGLAIARALPVSAGRWLLRARLPGRWYFEASCAGMALRLMPSVVTITREMRGPVVLEAGR